ncbi:tetratricopeptide repeat protein [Aestuariirhabdus litorea]|uniref:Tetratricopeptide repeat protein n=1 Tax=Aestuariirhabdus litorea TaxID=2528527 RepID=A0A3P3VKS7_9GAMM|nr:tetratricopeptide repeat protein [Aestuariirhabdus litorea]RRJ82369.1 tetratricopeptide repeat protein [Aestuariirhabdus litorea]RWW92532.1 tetratricopeptide repeat protein [Endozoicomonadaceae bacterium GTF-13]
MKRQGIITRTLGVVLLVLLPAMPAQALSPEMEMDRYLLAAQRHVRLGNFREAEQYLQRAVALQIPPPAEFYYVYGEVLHHNGKLQLARETLEKYLQQTQKEGEYYRDALELLTLIEEREAKPLASPEPDRASVVNAGTQQADTWMQQLKSLYLTDSTQEALLLHINGLLRNFVVRDSRVLNLDRADDHLYQLSVPQRGELMVTLRRAGENGYQYSNAKLRVFGINPYVEARCDRAKNLCSIAHPVSGKTWLEIRRDDKAAAELSKSLTALIKQLQE